MKERDQSFKMFSLIVPIFPYQEDLALVARNKAKNLLYFYFLLGFIGELGI